MTEKKKTSKVLPCGASAAKGKTSDKTFANLNKALANLKGVKDKHPEISMTVTREVKGKTDKNPSIPLLVKRKMSQNG